MKKTSHTNQPNLSRSEPNEWCTCDGLMPLLEWINHLEIVVDVHASSFHEEELWNAQRTIAKLKAFLLILPERTVSKLLRSTEFNELQQSILQEWAESTSPLDGWSDQLLS